MVKRIEISPTAFKISQAGHDVTTATGSDILFDFLSNQYAGVVYQGSVAWGASGWSTTISTVYEPNDTAFYQYTYTFPTAFGATPKALVAITSSYINSNGTVLAVGSLNAGTQEVIDTGRGGTTDYLQTWADFTISASSITFRVLHQSNVSGFAGGSPVEYRFNFNYSIFQI